jgi:hypothetical protein
MIGSFLYTDNIKQLYAMFLEKSTLYARVSNNTLILKGRLERIYIRHQLRNDKIMNYISGLGGISAIIGSIICSS